MFVFVVRPCVRRFGVSVVFVRIGVRRFGVFVVLVCLGFRRFNALRFYRLEKKQSNTELASYTPIPRPRLHDGGKSVAKQGLSPKEL